MLYKKRNLKYLGQHGTKKFELPDGSYSASDIQIILNTLSKNRKNKIK